MKTVEYGKQNNDIIMLLHGGGLSWWNYRAEAELLSERCHVVLPILDGHAGSDNDFVSIEENASRIISFIDREYGGSVLLIGGLSLGAQVLVEMLTQRKDICPYDIIESASVIPSMVTNALVGLYLDGRPETICPTSVCWLRSLSTLMSVYLKSSKEKGKGNL